MWRCFKITQNMVEKEVGIGIGGVPILLRIADRRLAIVEDNDLVDAEDGTCACDLTGQCSLLLVSPETWYPN